MRYLLAALGLVFVAECALASGPVVTESAPGLVFGGDDCAIKAYAVNEPTYTVGSFNDLVANVVVDLVCRDADGREHGAQVRDDVSFPNVGYDAAGRTWYFGNVKVAQRGFNRIELNPDLRFVVWSAGEETLVRFKVQITDP